MINPAGGNGDFIQGAVAAVKLTATRSLDLCRLFLCATADFVRRLDRYCCWALQDRLGVFCFFIGEFRLLWFLVHWDELHGVGDDVFTIRAVSCDLDPSSHAF